MSATSSIEWTEKTWNPVRGCSIVSPGCVNCYAMKQAHRFSRRRKEFAMGHEFVPGPYFGLTKQTKAGPQWTGKVVTVESALLEPLSWKKPQRIFVNSMSDLFHEDVPTAFIDRVFAVMAWCDRHTFQILTKRAGRMRAYLDGLSQLGIDGAARRIASGGGAIKIPTDTPVSGFRWPLPNVWLGVSVEDQQRADERIPLLLQTPAAVRFISAEPLFGSVDLENVRHSLGAESFEVKSVLDGDDGFGLNAARPRLDWVIVGGESGSGARPCDLAWIRSIVEQCHAARVACFVKQLGAYPAIATGKSFETHTCWCNKADTRIAAGEICLDQKGRHLTRGADFTRADAENAFPVEIYRPLHLHDRKGGDMSEWPADLRVRQFPTSNSQLTGEAHAR